MTGTFSGIEVIGRNDGTYDMILYQGKTVSLNLTASSTSGAMNLSGYSARLKARKAYDGDTIVNFSSTDNSITFPSATAGQIRIVKTAAQTAALSVTQGVYDFELESSTGDVNLLMYGSFKVFPEVTK
jgi:hypothetical protein